MSAIVPTMTMTAGHCRIRCDLWKLGWDGCRGGPQIKKSSMKFNRTNWRFFWKNTSFLSQALCKVSASRFYLGELWILGDAMSFVHGSEAFTWRSSVTGCFWGPSWRSSWFPGARLTQPTNLQFCCGMMISVWRMWWKTMVLASKRSKSGFLVFGVNGGLVRLGFRAFFFSTMYQLKGKQLRNPQLDFCRRVQPLGGFRIYHCSKDIQTLGTPRSWFWCVCSSGKNASLLDKMEGKRLVNMKYCEYEVVLNNSDLL